MAMMATTRRPGVCGARRREVPLPRSLRNVDVMGVSIPFHKNQQFSINKQPAAGTLWVFGKIAGASAWKIGTDVRPWHLWVTDNKR